MPKPLLRGTLHIFAIDGRGTHTHTHAREYTCTDRERERARAMHTVAYRPDAMWTEQSGYTFSPDECALLLLLSLLLLCTSVARFFSYIFFFFISNFTKPAVTGFISYYIIYMSTCVCECACMLLAMYMLSRLGLAEGSRQAQSN